MSTSRKIRSFFTSEKFKKAAPFLLLFVTALLLHLMLWEHPDLDTARYFSRVLRKHTMWEFLSDRYHSWSSRLVIEGFLALLAKSLPLWKLLDSLLFPLLALSLTYLLTGKFQDVRMNWFVVGGILLYPFGEMQSAGWTATTMNYFWPLALGIFSCTAGAVWLYTGRRPKWYHTLLCVLAGVYACNMEQMCGVLFAVYLALFVLILRKKKTVSVEMLLLLAVCILNLVLILTCPGNRVRMAEEIATCQITGFAEMNIPEKLSYALNNTCHIMLEERFVFLAASSVLFVLVWRKSKSFVKRLVALFPLMLLLYRSVVSSFFPSTSLLLLESPVLSRETAGDQSAWAMLFLWLLLLSCTALSILFLCDTTAEKILLPLLFFVGLCSRLVVGLSPTLENSLNRTFLYFDLVLLFLMLWGIRKTAPAEGRTGELLRLLYGGAAVFSTVGTFLFAARLTILS